MLWVCMLGWLLAWDHVQWGVCPFWCVHPRGVWQGSAFIAGAMVCLIFFTSWRDSGA
jgi:hypothetical protein